MLALLLLLQGADGAGTYSGTAKQLGLPGYNITYGFGRVDAAAATSLCKQICP